MCKRFLQSKEKLLEGGKERTLKLTAFQTKAILIGNFFHSKQPASGIRVNQGAGGTVALQLSTVWDLFPTESSKVAVLESCVLEQPGLRGREVLLSP